MHGKIDQVISEVGFHIRNVIIYAAYMMGYLSKSEQALESGAPTAMQTSKDCVELGNFTERLREELHGLHDLYPNFTSLDVFTPLSEVVHDMYKTAGLTFVENNDGTLRVEIPHRADTLPSLEEQFEFLAQGKLLREGI